MSMNDLVAAFELVERNEDDSDFEGSKSEEPITSAEAALGLKFPPTYRAFLERLGCGDIAGFEVYGLIGPEFVKGSWLCENSFREPSDARLIQGVPF